MAAADPRATCPGDGCGAQMNAHYGETRDVFYCERCGHEAVYVLEKRRVLRPTELSPRPRGGDTPKRR